MEAFDNPWQIIGTVSSDNTADETAAMSMDMMSMCNINLLYFAVHVLYSCGFCGYLLYDAFSKRIVEYA